MRPAKWSTPPGIRVKENEIRMKFEMKWQNTSKEDQNVALNYFCCTSITHLMSSNLEVVGAPQIANCNKTFPPFPVFRPSWGILKPHSCPLFDVIFPSLFFCLPLLLASFSILCRIIFAIPEDLEMWPHHLSLCGVFTMFRRSSCIPVAFWMLLRASPFVTRSL